MFFSLDLYIKTTSQDLIDDIESVCPESNNIKVVSEYYQLEREIDQFDNFPVISGMIRFYSEGDRQILFDEIMGINEIFVNCEIGSYIKLHDCNLDKAENRSCINEVVFKVTE